MHNWLKKKLIHDRLIWMRFSSEKTENNKSDIEWKFQIRCWQSDCILLLVQAVKQFCPTNTDMLTAPHFFIHIYFSTNTGFLRTLGFAHVRGAWNNAPLPARLLQLTLHTFTTPSEFHLALLHIHETLEFPSHAFLGRRVERRTVIPERWPHPSTGNADDVLT